MVRFKNRYLVCEIKWEDGRYDPGVKNKDLFDAIKESIGSNFGDWGTGILMSSLSVKYWNPSTNIAIVRCLRDEFRVLWGGLFFISHIRGRKVRLKVKYTGGTIRSCQKVIVKDIREWLMDYRNVFEQLRKKQEFEQMIKEVEEIVP